jgi:hypothetical protein
LPRRPQQLTAERESDGRVELSWGAALDCDGGAVAGYHLYRRLSSEAGYTRVSAAPVTGLAYTDTEIAGARAGAVYYYALAAVDGAGDESVKSAPASVTVPAATESTSNAGGAGSGGGCFIGAANADGAGAPALSAGKVFLAVLGAVVFPISIKWSGNRRGRWARGSASVRVLCGRGFGDDAVPVNHAEHLEQPPGRCEPAPTASASDSNQSLRCATTRCAPLKSRIKM